MSFFAVGVVLGAEFWEKKPPGEWTVEEALKVLTDSPWAHEQEVGRYDLLTRKDSEAARIAAEERRRTRPRREPTLPPPATWPAEPNVHDALSEAYLVRWESAPAVAAAFKRLEELGEQASATFQAPPPRLPADRYVVTVKTTRPPLEGRDLFEGLTLEELKAGAELKSKRERVPPVEVERSGVGATAAVHFYFPRLSQGRPFVSAGEKEVEFRFEGKRYALTSKFEGEAEAGR